MGERYANLAQEAPVRIAFRTSPPTQVSQGKVSLPDTLLRMEK